MTQRRIYQCDLPYHIAFNVLNRECLPAGRHGFFEDGEKAELLHGIILNAGEIKNHIVYQFCIMPDHVHVLCKTQDGSPPRTLERVRCGGRQKHVHHNPRRVPFLRCEATHQPDISDFVQSIKGTFSRKMHMGHIWQRRFHDEIIQTDQQLREVIDYITYNPIKAELSKKWDKNPYQYKNDDLIHKLFF